MPGIFSVSGSPVTGAGTLAVTLGSQSQNLVWASPNGSSGTPTFRALVGADLPNPSASTLGGIESYASVTHQWINTISTGGVPSSTQPAFTDISGTLAASQCPNPSASTIGCVESYVAVSHQWINAISTGGAPSSTQPAFSDISGQATLAQLPTIGNNTILSNISGGSATPLANSQTALLDTIASTQGDILYRNASAWVALAPGTNGQVLTTAGAAANPSWTTVTGTGTVTSVATNNGVTGGTITTTGTIGLATIATGNVLAYTSGGTGVPVATTPTLVLDVIGSTEGDVLYRGASAWSVLAPGTNGQFLQTTGAGSTPQWASAVTSIGLTNTYGLSISGSPVTTSGSISAGVSLSTASNVLGSDVSMTMSATYFDGPSMAQGTSGTWFASGGVTVIDGTASNTTFDCKLWDGTTVFASGQFSNNSPGVTTANGIAVHFAGFLASPAANIRISCKANSTTSVMKFNASGNSKDSYIYGFRIS
jgi:hypothetical protein